MEDIKLSEHFRLEEFCRTRHLEFAEANYDLAISNLHRLGLLAADLEVIRGEYGCPIIITCGVRCPGHNAAVGGSPTSQHTKAEAADFIISGVNLRAVFEWIVKSSGLKYGQVIHETKGSKVWIHYSLGEPFRAADRSRQALISKDGKYEAFAG